MTFNDRLVIKERREKVARYTSLDPNKFQNICRSAIDLFYEQGIEKTTIQQITKNSGIAKGTFYLYFKNKEELVNHIINHCFELHIKASIEDVDKQKTVCDKLKKRVKNILLFSNKNPKEAKIIRYFYAPVNLVGTENVPFEKSYEINKNYIKEGIRNGELKNLPLDYLFAVFFSAVEGISSYVLKHPDTLEDEVLLEKMLDSVIDTIRYTN